MKTRFAPSPTGFLHIGGLRTALYAYLFARQNKGGFILRIEDTDQKRYTEGATENLIRTLEWFGIDYDEGPYLKNGKLEEKGDEGPYFQSKRTETYKKYADKLMKEGHAYPCFCSEDRLEKMRMQQAANKQAPMYDRHCLFLSPEEVKERMDRGDKYVIRQRIPEDPPKIEFEDTVRGKMEFDPKTIDDQILIKSDGFPTYHLANVVDDHMMGITHVIRGEEWLPSTPKHIALYQALGWEPPTFAHIPLLLNPDKTKLSKRQGDVAAEDYIQKGYLREAIINFIAFLGWNPGTEEEFFSMEDLVEKFSISRVQKAGAIFNLEKLEWMNGHYIREKSVEDLAKLILPRLQIKWFHESKYGEITEESLEKPDEKTAYFLKTVEVIQTRMKTLEEAPEMLKFFLEEEVSFDKELLLREKMKVDEKTAKLALEKLIETLKEMPEEDFADEEKQKELLIPMIKNLGLKNGQVLWPMRVALTGAQYSPGAFEVAATLGKERSIKRLKSYLDKLS